MIGDISITTQDKHYLNDEKFKQPLMSRMKLTLRYKVVVEGSIKTTLDECWLQRSRKELWQTSNRPKVIIFIIFRPRNTSSIEPVMVPRATPQTTLRVPEIISQ